MQQPTVNISVGQTPQQAPFPKPNNGLVLGILCLLFCCLPFGIFSVVKASQVDKLYDSGDYYGAKEAASTAKKLAIWGAVAGFVFYVVYIIAMVSGSMASMNYF